ncbi:helix-turn-helix domain-containing protein [Peribacillus kribbensis]|uniref:helix-turn-helix domain-containing protein n=1 Tax=Peribacillus kribbensis TaxID=356658 RepID=UPI000417BB77|nr:helix-turn-helix transcriptional regulator [Peribacillus kribbensis]
MIGKTIYHLRKKRNLSISELAERAGVSKSYISNIERNINQNPSIQIINKIAAVLDTDATSLLTKEFENEQEPLIDIEWIQFINDLKESGIEKEDIHQFKTLIEFIKWQSEVQMKK